MIFINETGKEYGNLLVLRQILSEKYTCPHWLCQCKCGNQVIIRGSSLRNKKRRDCGCSKTENKINKRYGRLVVIERVSNNRHGNNRWRCLCDCGNEKIICGSSLSRGDSKSCGCLRKILAGRAKIKNLNGLTFGRLRVIKLVPGEEHRTNWLCQCSCGQEVIIPSLRLLNGHTKSCGCLLEELRAKRRLPKGRSAFNSLFAGMKYKAGRRNYKWDLSKKEFEYLIRQPCYYCGIEPKQIYRINFYLVNSSSYIYNGIDRVDNDQGYNFNNCVSCCGKCNKAKLDREIIEFRAWIIQVYHHWAKTPNQIAITDWHNPKNDLISLAL